MIRYLRYVFTVYNMKTGNKVKADSMTPEGAFRTWMKYCWENGVEIPSHLYGYVHDTVYDLTVACLENGKFHMLTEKEIQEQLEERRKLCEPED